MKKIMKFLFCLFFSCTVLGILKDADIQAIYDVYVKPNINDEYKYRYVPLPLEKNNIPWKWEDKDFPRVIALLEFARFITTHKVSCAKGLAINGRDPEWYHVQPRQLVQIDYEMDPNTYDLHILNLPERDFDFVMMNQTLEHVYDPIQCLKNIYQHMAPGGILYLNVPVNNIPHSTPFHYYTGYTPVGLGAIIKAAGFRILNIGQWGNLEYLKKMFETNSWPDYRQLQNPGLNDFNCPVITWIFAIKE